jgi:cell division transport system permease protein
MRQFIEQHSRAFLMALSRLWKEPFGSLTTLIVIALALAVPATLYRVADLTRSLMQDDSHRPQILIVLKENLSEDRIKALKSTLTSRPDIKRVLVVGPEDGLKILEKRLGRDDLLAGLENNPLPTVLTLQPKSSDPDSLKALVDSVKNLPGVDHLRLDADWAKRLHALERFIDQGVIALSLVLLVAVLTVIFNTIRLQVSRSAEEIRICKLLGASDSFVRRPFIYFGALEMTLGAGLALILAESARAGFNGLSAQWLSPLGFQFAMAPLSLEEMGLSLGLSFLLGGLVSSVTVTGSLMRFR